VSFSRTPRGSNQQPSCCQTCSYLLSYCRLVFKNVPALFPVVSSLSSQLSELTRRHILTSFSRFPPQDQQSAAVFGEGESDLAEGRRASYRAVLEKKLSVAERAVGFNPACVPLQLERLRLCRELWEPAALAKEWKKLVRV